MGKVYRQFDAELCRASDAAICAVTGLHFNTKTVFPSVAIAILQVRRSIFQAMGVAIVKIRRSHDRLPV